jgi:RNA ligase
MKIKFPEYVRLHRIITNISNIDIWKTLKEDGNLDAILENVPDEFYNWVRKVEKELQEKRKDILAEVHADFAYIINDVLGYQATRKEYAEEFLKHPRSAFFFKWLDGKRDDVERMSWDLVRPEFSKPFSNVDENS